MSKRTKVTLAIAVTITILIAVITIISVKNQSSWLLWTLSAIGLMLVSARIYRQISPTRRIVLKPILVKVLLATVIIAALIPIGFWLKNAIANRLAQDPPEKKGVYPYNQYEYDYTSPPFQRIPGQVKKISNFESIVMMNGSEKEVDTKLTLAPGEEFQIEQIWFDEIKKNRITYNKKGDAAPIWGGNDFTGPWPVKYRVGRSGNGILAIVRNTENDQEKIFCFRSGQSGLKEYNLFKQPAKLILYYNTIIEFRDFDGRLVDTRSQCGWDGSTITLHIWLLNY